MLALLAAWLLYLSGFVVPPDLTVHGHQICTGAEYFIVAPYYAYLLLRTANLWGAFWLFAGWWANYSTMPWTRMRPAWRIFTLISPWIMAASVPLERFNVQLWSCLPFYLWALGLTLIQALALSGISIGIPDQTTSKSQLAKTEADSR